MKNRTVVITGATGDLGKVVTRLFSNDSNIAAVARSKEKLLNLEQNIKSSNQYLSIAADLTNPEQVTNAINEIIDHFNTIECLIHITGGYAGGKSIANTEIKTWDSMINLNLKTAFLCTKAVLPVMQKQNSGKIVTISAMAALHSRENKSAYAVSKAGLITFTQSIAEEGKSNNIQANTIAPGIIKTPTNIESMPNADHTKWVILEDIAETIYFLCSDNSSSITGTIIQMH